MSILRRHLSTGFTVLPTATLEDSRLSFRARGVLAFLISKPDAWRVRAESIASAGKEGKEAIKTALRELKDFGYYRVVTERLADGTLSRITEVYDTAQEWAAEEYRKLEARRVACRLKKRLDQVDAAADEEWPEGGRGSDGEEAGGTEGGFSGAGFPDAGSSGVLVSNQSQYPEKNPPTPTAGAAGEPGDAPLDETEEGSCPTHPDRPGRSCRGCGTSPRQLRASQQRAEKERFKAREREANERVLAQVRRKPGVEGLSEVARQQLAAMRSRRREAAAGGGEVESPSEIG
ncbi:hypothetical protein GCM10022403_080260 [Streptomyces coacervatus]|uniref:Helix-turn-helix domain-containing protein n=1 Tax=Streptomyces coacervatus TaxID=647381 RepID=A0ABP7J789_9ACTN|nr:hypothetical protein [Streptomyces coacervatus]MDF2269404.1 hypothetical protein [Streptomyces coacervatus]